MSDDLVKRIKDRGDWLVDAVATATQNRQFLRGDPECDDVACDAICMNGEKAMTVISKPLADRIEELEATGLANRVAIMRLEAKLAQQDERGFWLGRSCGGSKAEIDAALSTIREGGE